MTKPDSIQAIREALSIAAGFAKGITLDYTLLKGKISEADAVTLVNVSNAHLRTVARDALTHLDALSNVVAQKNIPAQLGSPYGYCPICNAPGEIRERRIDGNDKCKNGHCYPSRDAKTIPAQLSGEELRGLFEKDWKSDRGLERDTKGRYKFQSAYSAWSAWQNCFRALLTIADVTKKEGV